MSPFENQELHGKGWRGGFGESYLQNSVDGYLRVFSKYGVACMPVVGHNYEDNSVDLFW
ncbi:MAG: hypothetical protein ACUVUU_04690 [bacterium]